MFPSPREDYGGSNRKVSGSCGCGWIISLPSRGLGGSNKLGMIKGRHEMFPYPLEDLGGSNLAIDRTLTTWMLRFRTLARFRGNLTNIQSKLAIEIARFPSPREDCGGANIIDHFCKSGTLLFPSPLED